MFLENTTTGPYRVQMSNKIKNNSDNIELKLRPFEFLKHFLGESGVLISANLPTVLFDF